MRITVIGLPGSGKSTVARMISEKLSIPHIHIDRFWFEAGGRTGEYDTPNIEQVRAHVKSKALEAIKADSWVSDGFYSRLQPEIASRANIVLFLDIPLWRRLLNHATRTLQRTSRHKEVSVWDDLTFFPEVVRRTFVTGPKIQIFLNQYKSKVVTLKSRKKINRYVTNLQRTERLFFRPLKLGDEEYIFPEVDAALTEHWIGWEPFKNIEEARKEVSKCVERAKHSPNVEFIVFNHAGDFVGCCDVSPCVLSPSIGKPEYEINLWVKRSEWSKGYGREMCNIMIEWAKQNTDLPYVVYSVTSGNVASERIAASMHLPVLRQFKATKRGTDRIVTDYKLSLR